MCYQAQMKTNMNPRHNNFHTSADCTVLCTVHLLYKMIQNYLKLCLLSAYEWSSRVHGSSCYTKFLVCSLLIISCDSNSRNSSTDVDILKLGCGWHTMSSNCLQGCGYNINIRTSIWWLEVVKEKYLIYNALKTLAS